MKGSLHHTNTLRHTQTHTNTLSVHCVYTYKHTTVPLIMHTQCTDTNSNTSLHYAHLIRSHQALEGKKCTLIKLIDVLDVHGSFVPNFSRLAAGLPVVVIGNKFDLMPNGAKPDRIRCASHRLGLSRHALLLRGCRYDIRFYLRAPSETSP